MDRTPTLRIGDTLGRFEITDVLPAGGQGEVYRAKDATLQRDVAIKLLLGSDPQNRERFIREAQMAAKVSHQNIVRVFEPGAIRRGDEELPYLVMEFIEGKTLAERMRDASKDQRLGWLSEVAEGLAELHRHDVVHRDLKPKNIMIATDNHARIIDLGLAKTPGTTVTSTNKVVGTLDYLSPEQAHGDRVTYRSDIFSFGIILYEALTGQHPFRRATEAATVHRIVYEPPDQYIPGREGEIAARCLRKDPMHRYDDAADIARDLRELQPTPPRNIVEPIPTTVDQDATTVKITSGLPPPSSPRAWRLLALITALLLAGSAAVLYTWKLRSNLALPPQAMPTTAPAQEATLPACGLSASPGTIAYGQTTELRWSSTSATDIVISPNVGIVGSSGSIDVSPRATTRYEVVATNADGVMARGSVTVNVTNVPADFREVGVVGSIVVGPDKIRPGESTSLGWNSFHATRVVITPSIGIVPLEGRIQVAPRTTTTYTMAMTNDAGGFSTLTAFVNVDEAAQSHQTAASREVTCATATQQGTGILNSNSTSCTVPLHRRVIQATLSYTLDDGGSISINGRNVFTKRPNEGPREGTINLPAELFVPGKSFLLRVEARNALKTDGTPDGALYGEAHVRLVTIDTMAGLEISVSPGTIRRGETARLTWSSQDAATLALNPLVGLVEPRGSMTVSPAQTTTYILRGWSASGDPATARATVEVQ